MSHSTNPKIIGAFVTVSIALSVALVLFFGSAKLFSQSIHYIVFFENSVNGLDVGSPVKYKGVPVGVVERILIRVEGQSKDSTSIPVIVRIDRTRLTNRLGDSVEVFEPEFIYETIESGLVAQLSVDSYITGKLFVEFSLQPGQGKDFVKHRDGDYGMVEIPSIGSQFSEITDDMERVIATLSELDYGRTYKTLNRILEGVLHVLEGSNTEELSRSIIKAVDQITLLLKSKELKATLLAIPSALEQIEGIVATYDLENGRLAGTNARLDTTLDNLNTFILEGTTMIAPQSAIRYELQSSLRELKQAAQSLRIFVDYLEQNPNALLTGRSDESK